MISAYTCTGRTKLLLFSMLLGAKLAERVAAPPACYCFPADKIFIEIGEPCLSANLNLTFRETSRALA